jgi:hypothetical protein
MNYLNYELCKMDDTCQHVVPIVHGESIGNSLSSIVYNFRSLDIQTCNLEYSARTMWNAAHTMLSELSSTWIDSMDTMGSYSACWQDTYTTVSELSAFWLKPITLLYPFPFSSESTGSIILTITDWLNDNFPVVNGSCYNFIVGQEMYVFTPYFQEINRVLSKTVNQGIKTVGVVCSCSCIKRGTYSYIKYGSIDCGSITATIDVPDKYIERFAGLKFEINPSTLQWVHSELLFN